MNRPTNHHARTARRPILCAAVLVSMAAGCALTSSEGQGPALTTSTRQQLTGHLNPEMSKAPVVSRLPATTQLTIVLGLPVKDEQAIAKAVEAVSDPTSPTYRQFITPAQFADRYGASAEDYEKVVAWAEARGLKAVRHTNRLLVEATGAAADLEAALHVHLNVATRPDGSLFHAPDGEPSLDLDVPVAHVGNLDDYVLPRHAAGSGPGGARQGQDFRNAYASCTALSGTGQTIGIVMLDGFAQNDITGYFTSMGLPVPLTVQTVPAGNGTTPGTEGTLDVEMALSMAPGAQVVAFTGGLDSVLANMAERPDIKQVSSSWFTLVDTTAQASIAQLALQGTSFLQASGDSPGIPANYVFSNSDFRLLPSVTNVGGTALNMNGNGASYGTETGWGLSAGGVLTHIPIPSYQAGLATAANQGSTVYRNIPDISAEAADVGMFFQGTPITASGTSAAAPLMAGFMALVNQELAANGKPSLGPLNPTLYAAARSSYATAFNDITQGSNSLFNATAGYDLVTGLGSPKCGLIAALTGFTPPAAPPTCTTGASCAGITGYAPPDLTAQCNGAPVDFFRQYPAGERVFLATASTYTDSMNDYNDFLVACTHGTQACSLYSEDAPTSAWCNQSTGSSGSSSGGIHSCKGDNCCYGKICQ